MKVSTKKEIVVFTRYLSRFGVVKGAYLYLRLKFFKVRSITIPGIDHPFSLRPGTTDITVFDQIFVSRQYNFPIDVKPEIIVDCGANIGLASIYFANKFPGARIISVEPELSNYDALRKNCDPYKNITVINSAIWYEPGTIQLFDPGLGNYGFTTIKSGEGNGGTVVALTIRDIMQRYGLHRIDLLKIDIEGAEKEVFTYNYEFWLPLVRTLVVEVHDRLREGTSTALIKAISQYDFNISSYGESFVCHRGSGVVV